MNLQGHTKTAGFVMSSKAFEVCFVTIRQAPQSCGQLFSVSALSQNELPQTGWQSAEQRPPWASDGPQIESPQTGQSHPQVLYDSDFPHTPSPQASAQSTLHDWGDSSASHFPLPQTLPAWQSCGQ